MHRFSHFVNGLFLTNREMAYVENFSTGSAAVWLNLTNPSQWQIPFDTLMSDLRGNVQLKNPPSFLDDPSYFNTSKAG